MIAHSLSVLSPVLLLDTSPKDITMTASQLAQKSIYDRMASSALTHVHQTETGTSPQRTFIAVFNYANGLRTAYDGNKWRVIDVEDVPEYTF